MGNLADAMFEHANDRTFLHAVGDLIAGGFRLLRADPPKVEVEERDGKRTLVIDEPQAPYRWRFWPDVEANGWLAEFQNTIADDDDNWTPVFVSSEFDESLRLDCSADDIALWIVALTGPEV